MGRPTIALLAVLVASVAFSVGLKAHIMMREDPDAVLRRGEPAPAFALETLDGAAMELQQVAGENRVVLVNFWATWCQPCRIEMPQLERIYAEHHGDGLEILAISAEEPATIAAFLAERSYSYPVLVDHDGAVSRAYGIEAIPTTVLIDSDGEIIRVRTGLSPVLEAEVTGLMRRQDR